MTTHEQDEIELRRHIAGIIRGIATKDLDALRRLYADDVVSFDVEPPLPSATVPLATIEENAVDVAISKR